MQFHLEDPTKSKHQKRGRHNHYSGEIKDPHYCSVACVRPYPPRPRLALAPRYFKQFDNECALIVAEGSPNES